jgi:hypothetical protein
MGVSEKTDPHFATTLEDGKEGVQSCKIPNAVNKYVQRKV